MPRFARVRIGHLRHAPGPDDARSLRSGAFVNSEMTTSSSTHVTQTRRQVHPVSKNTAPARVWRHKPQEPVYGKAKISTNVAAAAVVRATGRPQKHGGDGAPPTRRFPGSAGIPRAACAEPDRQHCRQRRIHKRLTRPMWISAGPLLLPNSGLYRSIVKHVLEALSTELTCDSRPLASPPSRCRSTRRHPFAHQRRDRGPCRSAPEQLESDNARMTSSSGMSSLMKPANILPCARPIRCARPRQRWTMNWL